LIDKLVAHYAFVYPDVRIQLKQENRLSFQTSGNGDEREVLGVIYGTEVARQMLEVLSEEELLKVKGFISPTNLSRSNRREIIFFVNGRPVQDPALSAATIKAYHTLLMVGRYPISILSLDLPAEKVDVNVHPTKAEVRFSDPGSIFHGVRNAVKRALLAHGSVSGIDVPPRWAVENNWGQPDRQTDTAWKWNLDKHRQQDESPIQDAGSQTSHPADQFPSQTDLPTKRVPLLRPVGQVAQSYLVAEGPDGLYLIDQHAAHERILFEQFMSQLNEKIPSQILLQPVTVELSPDDASLLEEQLHTLSKLGFQVEVFGQNTFLVRALPSLLTGSDPKSALRVLVEDFEEDETPLQNELEARIIARVCKRAAIKAGQNLSPEEQRALILDLEACQSPRTCPHGRPTMIHLSVDILERQFGRKGAR
jgi:DNA mismatch repair protein MutL